MRQRSASPLATFQSPPSNRNGVKLKNLVYKSVCFVVLAGAAALPASSEDLTVVSTVTSGKKAESSTATQYITEDKLRTSDGRYDTITDIASGRMVHVDHTKKEYWETSLAEMREQFAEIERMLEDNPMMGRMLGGATEVDVSKGSETREIAGYVCDQYLLTIGKLRFDFCAARDLKAPVEYHDAKKMVYATMGPMASRFEKLYEEMKKIDGFPLRTVLDSKIMGMKIHSVSEATEVRRGPIAPASFEPDPGYKKTRSPYEKK